MRALVLALVSSVFAVGVVGCTVESPTDEQTATTTDALAQCLPNTPACKPCPANKICPMIACVCELPPGQQSTCPYVAACIIGYTWDSHSCSCVPAK